MTETVSEAVAEPYEPTTVEALTIPWHFWAIAAVALLWNAFGALNYTMTQLRNPEWLAGVDAEVLEKVASAPAWATSAWAFGVWASFAGSVLLLLRSGRAVPAFVVSLVGAMISFAWQFQAGIVATPAIPIAIVAGVIFFWWYAVKMRDQGVLR